MIGGDSLTGWGVLSVIADIIGIVSFGLTVVLLIRSEALRKEVEGQRADYAKEQRDIRETLINLQKNVIDDNVLNLKVVSDIRKQLFSFQQKFKRLFSKKDKKRLKKTLTLLRAEPDNINRQDLSEQLDYFVARFERRELK